MRRDDQQTPERLDRFWDALVNRTTDADRTVRRPPDELEETVRWLQAADVPPRASHRFVDRLEEALMDQHPAAAKTPTVFGHVSRLPTRPNGVVQRGAQQKATSRGARRSSGVPALFAVLAILVTVAALGGRTWSPGLFGSSAPNPTTVLPAGLASGTPLPATPLPAAMEGGDAARTGVVPGTGPMGAPSVAWRLPVSRVSSLIVAGDRFYYTSLLSEADHLLIAADLATGATLWSTPVDMPVFGPSPSVADGRIYWPATQTLNAYDADTGAPLWSYDLGSRMNAMSATVADGLVYVTARDKTLRAVDAATGAERWRVPIPDGAGNTQSMLASVAQPVVADGVVYTAGNGGLLVATDARDGHQRWTFQTAGGMIPLPPRAADGVVVVDATGTVDGPDGADRWTQAVDAAGGTLRWQLPGGNAGGVVAIHEGVVYLTGAGEDRRLLTAVRLDDGTPLWTYQTSALALGAVVAANAIYLVTEDGTVEGIDLATRQPVLRVNLGSVANVAIGDGLLVASTIDAVLAVSGSPATGTPVAAATPADLSGLPPCTPPRAAPAEVSSGTPAATLEAETKVMGPLVPGTIAQILTENIPAGRPAPEAAVAGIRQTLDALADCAIGRTAEAQRIDGFFTDDFFRRGWDIAGDGAPSWPSAPQLLSEQAILQTAVLDDGRISAVVRLNASFNGPTILLIFKEVDGAWLIDEWYQVVTEYEGGKG